MSKYRPPTLPTGTVAAGDPDSAVPAVRTRAEIREEWERKRREDQEQQEQEAERVVEARHNAEPPPASQAPDVAGQEGPAPAEPEGLPAPRAEASLEPAGAEDDGLVNLPANRDDNGFVAIPEFTEPTSSDPKERLDHYARGVAAVEYAARANEQATNQQKVIAQGQYFLAIKDEYLWEAEGLPNFDALIQHRFGFGGDYANKQIRAMPVVRALREVTTMELKEKHLRALVNVQRNHGDGAVRKVWNDALVKGKITEKALKESAYFLGYGEPVPKKAKVVGTQRPESPAPSSPSTQLAEVVGDIRALIPQDRDQARRKFQELWAAAEELRKELGIDAVDSGSDAEAGA